MPTPPARAAIVAKYAGRRPQEWSSDHVTGLVRRTDSDKVVLTLDACGGPSGSQIDTRVLDLLRREHIPAVLFVNKRWIEANRAAFDTIASEQNLFDIGNHGTRHMPLSVTGRSAYNLPGTRDTGEVYDEVMGNHEFLTELTGTAPRFFRTGTAWYDEVAIAIIRDLGEIPIGFDINGDAGATYTTAQVARETSRATSGSIIIGHFNQPKQSTYAGLAEALPRMKDRGIVFSKLSDLNVT